MRTYLPRTVDDELARALRTSGAVVIKGPRACGKTETARGAAASEIGLDQDTATTALSAADPRLLLDGETPRLLDAWPLAAYVADRRDRETARLPRASAPAAQEPAAGARLKRPRVDDAARANPRSGHVGERHPFFAQEGITQSPKARA